MYRPHGYVRIWSREDDRIIEEDVVKCNHHQAIGFVQPGGKVLWPELRETFVMWRPNNPGDGFLPDGSVYLFPDGWRGRPIPQEQYTCRLCYEPICPRCANKPCRHFEKWLEAVERSGGILHRVAA